ncbi:3-hydroxyacyl-ACP dehydratase FabZ family protein [Salinimicrobium sp. GXAS 041]|uniref:3-hydroxyacyl-ACP dehydratase FabZ family protein n=1 Tax=Salinimicrobium sp. GXAS 041 TaxID=3400806 RepID=UPI003C740154
MNSSEIISLLPHSKPFLFVDELKEVSENGITGTYFFPQDSFFYEGHFKNFPVTPGVILTECMAQIGVVSLGIYLMAGKFSESGKVAMTKTDVDFYLPVYPGEEVKVVSEKQFFRFNKLKCKVKMFNAAEKLVCRGEISGMIKEDE